MKLGGTLSNDVFHLPPRAEPPVLPCLYHLGHQPVVEQEEKRTPLLPENIVGGGVQAAPFLPLPHGAPLAFCRGADLGRKAGLVSICTLLLVRVHLGTGSWMPAAHPFPPSEPHDGAPTPFQLSSWLVLPLPAVPTLVRLPAWTYPGPPFWSCLGKGGPLSSSHMGSIQLHWVSCSLPVLRYMSV